MIENGLLMFINDQLISAIYKPLTFLGDPSKRIFWVYLLTSITFAVILFIYRKRRFWWVYLRQNLFSSQIWCHPSSILDIKLILCKSLLRTFLFAPWLLSSYGLTIGVFRLANNYFGPSNPTFLSPTVITLLYTICLFTISDLSRYLLHRLCHQVPFLWEFHQIHHSAKVMSPLTLYRSHPLESLLFSLRSIIVTAVITGFFFYLFKKQTLQYQFLGVNIFGALFNIFGANLRHSHVWLSYGSIVERVFISPAQHQLHHSNDPLHKNKNFGSCLAIWDLFAGSHYFASDQSNVQFGISESEANHHPHSLISVMIGPFIACWKKTRIYQLFQRYRDVENSRSHR